MTTESQSQSQDRDREAKTRRFPLAVYLLGELLCTGVVVVSLIHWI